MGIEHCGTQNRTQKSNSERKAKRLELVETLIMSQNSFDTFCFINSINRVSNTTGRRGSTRMTKGEPLILRGQVEPQPIRT